VFFQPSRDRYPFLEHDQLKAEEVTFQSDDGTKLAAWYLSASAAAKAHPDLVAKEFKDRTERPRGLVVQWHGNAENMTSHYRFLAWITLQGYDLLTFDYRGYGASEGEKDVDGIYQDARAMIRHASALAKEKNLPLIFVGQSLGGSLLLRALSEVHPNNLKLLVIEAAFYGHRQIAREKLASLWFTWPLQWLPYLLISDRYKPGGPDLQKLPPVPKILIYSYEDPVIPYHHGEQLFADMTEPKELWSVHVSGHVLGLFAENFKFRKMLLERLATIEEGSRTNEPQPSGR
jgi:alpha-beta hydrolase superfamily lysophospholipase